MQQLIPVNTYEDILPRYRNTPISRLLEYHNLGRELKPYQNAEVLIGMCMDNRKSLRLPEGFAYVLRTGGGNLRFSEFKVSYAIAVGGVTAIALLAHDNCGMVGLMTKQEQFVQGLVERAGWTRERACEHFMNYAPMFEIDDETDFVVGEAVRLRHRYPGIVVAPLMYRLDDNRLYWIKE